MARPIALTEELKQKAREDFAAMLDGIKMSDGKLKYSNSYEYKDCFAVVWLTQEAYRKIVALVTEFKDEVGWHGSVSRLDNYESAHESAARTAKMSDGRRANEFIIEDIFVYPQEVTGSTVNTDQTAYTEWLYSLDDNTFNKIRMQGHSHVNMGVTPSSVDDKHRQQILDQLELDMFYIFMIWNKSLAVHTLIYDMERNVLYENKDVEVKLLNDGAMSEFLADAKNKVQKRVYQKVGFEKDVCQKYVHQKSAHQKSANQKSVIQKSGPRKPSNKKGKSEAKTKKQKAENIGRSDYFEHHDYFGHSGNFGYLGHNGPQDLQDLQGFDDNLSEFDMLKSHSIYSNTMHNQNDLGGTT